MADAAAPVEKPEDLLAVQERVLAVVRELAAELGGGRALRAASPRASLEREVGLGSLERVELLVRLESAFGRALGDRFLALDTAADLARALIEEAGGAESGLEARPAVGPAPSAAATAAIDDARTLAQSLWLHAETDPDRAHVYLREEDGREQTVTYGALRDAAVAVAVGLRERGVRAGDTVGLMLPTGVDFLRSFAGALLARAVPVPIYPPVRLDRLEEYASRQSAILADAGVKLLITFTRARPVAALLRGAVPTLDDVVSADDLAVEGGPGRAPVGAAEDPALIQYTSGSTGNPKGVLLTHANLLANIRAIAAGVSVQPTDVGVSWLPLYHDMGLIGSWLFCLHQGIPIAVLSPLAFLSRPERWLWAVHQRRGTLSAAPNFAYELCVRRIPDPALEGLDLSSWRCALNGAEPVNPDTLDRFARRFARYGFRREALLPVYGLAECSVALTFPPAGRGPKLDRIARAPFEREGRAVPAAEDDGTALRFVSEGVALPGHEVNVVDDAGADLPERAVGRIVFRGPSATPGYFHKPEATAAITLPDGWLDSGDLGYRADGELHVTGRLKDLVIKGGRNLVPQEIEEVAASVDGVRRGCVVAFGVAQETLGTESLVILAETRETDDDARQRLSGAIIERVTTAIGVPPDVVTLLPPGTVPKTPSGKIRRSAARELYQTGSLGRAPRLRLTRRLRLLLAAAGAALQPRAAAVLRVLYAAYLGTALVAAAIPVWILALLLPGRRASQVLARLAARLGLALTGCRLSVSGLENLPARGPLVLVVNHASYADVAAVLALLPTPVVFVAKKEVRSWPFFGTFVRRGRHITVDREDTQQSLADAGKVARAIEEGDWVLFFPEGTFTPATGLRPFRLGAFKTAVDTGVPVVPMALRGTRHVLRGGTALPRPGPVHLWIGPPLVADGTGWREVVSLRDRAAAAIAENCGEVRLDLVASGPPRE
jgi:1-acyl-sn-glycerol-3-phosphate acyltransferase